MSHDSLPDDRQSPSELEEQLVAYLDGELSPDESRHVEQLLASDPDIRRRLQGLESSWQALEELDPAVPDRRFTRTTMEMVAVAATEDLRQRLAASPAGRWRRRLAIVAGLLLAGLLGFALAAKARPDPDRQVLRDLPLLEHLDEYRQVDDVAFLKALAREGLFDEERTAH